MIIKQWLSRNSSIRENFSKPWPKIIRYSFYEVVSLNQGFSSFCHILPVLLLCKRKGEIKEVTKCLVLQALTLLKVTALPWVIKLNCSSATASNTAFPKVGNYTFKRPYNDKAENQEQFNSFEEKSLHHVTKWKVQSIPFFKLRALQIPSLPNSIGEFNSRKYNFLFTGYQCTNPKTSHRKRKYKYTLLKGTIFWVWYSTLK